MPETLPDQTLVPDGWEWKLVDITCEHCGAVNQLHEQPPEWLEHPKGVKWECRFCGKPGRLGGRDPVPPANYVLECVECHATFDPNTIPQEPDGTWDCPTCETKQRHVNLDEQAAGAQTGAAS